MDKLKLTYFDFDGGRAEPARLAFFIGGIPFEDHRFPGSAFAEIRKTTPLDQVPTLTINGVQVTQSDAITRYAGRLAGLYPGDPYQALLCDEIISALEDVNIKLGATFGLKDAALREAREKFVSQVLTRYLCWLEGQLDNHGGRFLVDDRLTIADLKAWCMLRWLGSGQLDHIPTDVVATTVPKLATYAQRIGQCPEVESYYRAYFAPS